MTAKKDLKRLVRSRQAKTGESYTAALAQLRAKLKRAPVEIEELQDVSRWAELEGFKCRAAASKKLSTHADSKPVAEAWFRSAFSSLRRLLLAVKDDAGASQLCACAFNGADYLRSAPSAIQQVLDGRRFIEQVQCGVRGVSHTGGIVAFDATNDSDHVTVLGLLIAPPIPSGHHRPLLWLTMLDEHFFDLVSGTGLGSEMMRQLALAGLGTGSGGRR